GSVSVSFFTTSSYGSITGSIDNSLVLDTSASTWESISKSGAIPIGTRWLLSQVYFDDSTLKGVPPDTTNYPGYVDAAELTITPEPATIAMLAIGGLALARKRKTNVR
ncbi:MAG: PEP-CTERM sorting domain-containing protein, partial [Sedimentisphaerales bacterium]|nr:PEP-CTERM sorting domain-containing protein [Sedimentisphaerales bacterium]